MPAAVTRTVIARDRGQCAFVGTSGRRCTERAFIERHHQDPYALGGRATVDNIALRCRRHNAYEAELIFGRFDATKKKAERAGSSPPDVTHLTRPSPPT